MTLQVRRVVVAHDAQGRSVVTSDDVTAVAPVRPGLDVGSRELWVTDTMPVDNSDETGAAQAAGAVARHHAQQTPYERYVGNGRGSAFRITEFPPGSPVVAHRTETVDYDVVVTGEIDLDLEDGDSIHLRAGDAVVLRGVTHAWANRGTTTAAVAFILIDAAPVVVNGEELRTHYAS